MTLVELLMKSARQGDQLAADVLEELMEEGEPVDELYIEALMSKATMVADATELVEMNKKRR